MFLPTLCAHCFAFFRMVPTAEMTVVLVPLAVVVTETTAGRVAVVVMMVGWARVTGMAESHLLFLFWASADESKHRGGVSDVTLLELKGPNGVRTTSGAIEQCFCLFTKKTPQSSFNLKPFPQMNSIIWWLHPSVKVMAF